MNDRAKAGRGARSAAAGTTLLKSVCDRLPIGFALFDASFRLAAWNARFAALRGYPRKLVKAGTLLESFVRFDAERGEYDEGAIDALTRTKLAALKRGRPAKREQALPDGRCLRIACQRVPEGGLLLTFEDVTAARHVAQRLRESERQLAEQTAEQTATAEILKVISSSPTDVQPVFHEILRAAVHLCGSSLAAVFRFDGELLHLAATHNWPPEALARVATRFPAPPNPQLTGGRVILSGKVVRQDDALSDASYDHTTATLGGWRRMLGVPMLRDGVPIGAIVVTWREPGETPDRQVELLQTFADQAVIAVENARLFSETKEALEQQTATAEILKVISRSPTDVQPVFEEILRAAVRLCGSSLAAVFRFDGKLLHLAATHNWPADVLAKVLSRYPMRPDPGLIAGRVVLSAGVVRVVDAMNEPYDALRAAAAAGVWRRILGVPMLRDGEPIGAIVVTWREPGETPDRQVELLRTFADQAVIAVENVRLFSETKESLEQQTATAEILRVISESPGDLDPVFRAILDRATGLCDAQLGIVFRWDGERYHVVATRGEDADAIARWREAFAAVGRPGPHSGLGRLLVDKQPVHIPDILEEAAHREGDPLRLQTANILKARSFLAVPLLKNDAVIGAVVIYRHEVRPFSARQVELVQVFADQAVIAIENVRLFNELQARNRELTESLDQQTATAEILKVISSSPTDVQPVFDAIVKSGVHLFQGVAVTLRLVKGERIERAAFAAGPDCKVTDDFTKPSFPLDERNFSGRAVLRQEVVHASDVFAEDWAGEEVRSVAQRMGWRAIAAAPMLREGKGLGAINVVRAEAAPFSEKEIALLRTFADQAVIAIENVRLFNELEARNRELTGALDREKATGEILRVISSSPTDIQPVLDAVAERAGQLCDSPYTNVLLIDGDQLRVMSVYSTEPGPKPDRGNFVPISRSYVNGRAVLDREIVHIPDVLPLLDTEFPDIRRNQRKFGFRAVLVVPLMREGRAVGTIFIWRREPGLFSDDQVGLLKTFADQAVIAIENVRLFNELEVRNRDLTESLEQQTATAEILRVISNSPTDITPVLDAVAENAARLCDANDVVVMMNEGNVLRAVKSTGPFGERFGAEFAIPITRGSAAGRAVIERTTVQVPDFELESDEEYPVGREHQRIYGNHGAMATPLLRGDAVLGVIAVLRRDVRPFSERQSALLQTFADQAAIAIANVRLFNETKEALDRQTATAEILKAIASSPADEQPVFDAIIAHAGKIAGGCSVNVSRLVGDKLHLAAYTKISPEADDLLKSFYPISATEARPLAEAVHRKDPSFVSDFENDPNVSRKAREVMRARGFRSTVYVPIVHGNVVYGVMHVSKVEPGPFPDHWVNMLRTFADQAVIAIENVRLFNETKEALDQLKASAEVLQVISSSVADTQPVFDKILESCQRLFGGHSVGITQIGNDGAVHLGAYQGRNREAFERNFPVPLDMSGTGTAILTGRVAHYPDIEADGVPPTARLGARAIGFRSVIFAPMLWEGRGIGAIFVGRDTVGEFSDKEISLLKTFADQAVIAIQNARLFNEIQEKSHQLEIANQHKSAFLANMSHELRTPLNAVIGFSEMLAARYFGDLTEKQAEYVNDIHGSGKHLLSLINDILDLSKIEAGRMELELGEFDLRAALDNALTLVRERAQRGGVTLRFDADAALGSFRGDERKLKQVMLNLLSNAVKFTPRGGAVSVAAKRVDDAAEIAVSDTGAGIAPEDQEAIFEAFRQVGTDVTRKREGTGLGLALTRRFVELHGGTIRVESALGKGSTFTVRLPIRHGE